jgi:hypothetical protein
MNVRITVLLVSVSFLLAGCPKKPDEPAEAGTSIPEAAPEKEQSSLQRIESDVRFLADDKLSGRPTPSEHLDQAAEYLANQLRSAGWKPFSGNDYIQKFPLEIMLPDKAEFVVEINGKKLDEKEYLLVPSNMHPDKFKEGVTYDLVFTGHGIVMADKQVDDLKGADVKGKAAINLVGAPWETNPNVTFMPDRAGGKFLQAVLKGASLDVHVTDDLDKPADPPPNAEIAVLRQFAQTPAMFIPGEKTFYRPVLILSKAAFDRTLSKPTGARFDQWQKKLAKGGVKPKELKAKLKVRIKAEVEKADAGNVVAILPGADEKLKDEWLVLMAHYDHLGAAHAPAGQDNICNGADDNASGTAAVMEVARLLAQGEPPKRSIIAVLTAGEENGTQGSVYFTAHPPAPMNKVVLAFNVDMVGRSDGSAICRTTGSDQLFTEAVEMGKKHGIEVQPDIYAPMLLLYFTDALNLAKHSIPTVDFFTHFHADYHMPTDEVDKIKFNELEKIAKVIHGLVDRYAQGAPRPEYKRPSWFILPD